MSTQSYSSIGAAGRRRGTAHDDIDRSFYAVGQTLASIVNDPRAPSQSGGFWGLASEATQLPAPPAPLDPAKYPPVSKADLQRYIQVVHGAYDKFVRDRQSLEAFDAQHQGRRASERLSSSSSSGGQQHQGEPFMVAVQAVPSQFFQEGFFDDWDDFFRQYCQEQSAEELYDQIDLLNRNLDVVELQLLREVASRSSHFFQAASTLQGLQGQLSEAVGCIRGLRGELADADACLYSTAAAVKGLQARREHLQDTLDITKGLMEVVATQAALDVMLEGQDYAGALDLLATLRSLLQKQQLAGLQCLRHLPARLMDVSAAVDQALAGDFLAVAANGEVRRIAAQAAADAEAHPDASISPDGLMAAAGTWCLTDPAAATAAAAAAAAAADEQLTEKLLPLAVGLYRSEALGPTLQQYKGNAGEEVKAGVREVVQQVLPVLLAACGDSLPPQQGAAAAGGGGGEAWDQLQLLPHGAFMVLLHAAGRVILSCIHHTLRVGRVLEAILAGIDTPHSEAVRVLKACGVAVQVAADMGLGRWVKLLNARSTAHTRLKQYELKQILDLSEQVCGYVESVGARPLSSFRVCLQGACKGLLDAHHARHMGQLQGLLEAEQWVAVEVPAGFQAIVDRLLLRCAEGAALLDGRDVQQQQQQQQQQQPAGTPPTHARRGSSGAGTSPSRTPSAPGDAAAAAAPAAEEQQQQPVLRLCGKSFHLVNSALMLLKMVEDYMSLHDLMPQFGAEIVHRQLELLKLFNSQTAALVLGAGAMRTAGLRSISAKQLALSCQAVAMLATLLVPLRAGCLALVSQPRRALLMPEYDRLLQDLNLHVDEIHSKLVDIMRDRLAAVLQALPAEVRAAGAAGAGPGSGSGMGVGHQAPGSGPTPTIALLTKQLSTLRGVLVPLLLKEEVEFVFGAVSRSYSDALSDAFEALLEEPNSGWEQVVAVNALTMLEAFRELPLDPARANNYSARLTTTYTKHFGLPPWDQQRLGHKLQGSSSGSTLAQQQQQQDDPPSPAAAPPPPPQQQQQQEIVQAPLQEELRAALSVTPEPVAAVAAVAAAGGVAAAAAAKGQGVPGDNAADDSLTAASTPVINGLHTDTPAAAAAAADSSEAGAAAAPVQQVAEGSDLQQPDEQAAAAEQQWPPQPDQQKDKGQQQEQLHVPLPLQQEGNQLLAEEEQVVALSLQQQQQQQQLDLQQQQQQLQPAHGDGWQTSQQDTAPVHAAAAGGAAADDDVELLLNSVADSHQQEEAAAQLKQQLPEQQRQPPVLPDRLGSSSSSSSLEALQSHQPNGLPPADEAAVTGWQAGAAAPSQPGGGQGDCGQQSASSHLAFDGTAEPSSRPGFVAAEAAVEGADTLGQGHSFDGVAFMDEPQGTGASGLAFMDAPPAAAAFMDAPPAAAAAADPVAAATFMDAPPPAGSGGLLFMEGPPPPAAAAAEAALGGVGDLLGAAGWGQSAELADMMQQLGARSAVSGPAGAAAATAAGGDDGGGSSGRCPLDLLDGELQELDLGGDTTGTLAGVCAAAADVVQQQPHADLVQGELLQQEQQRHVTPGGDSINLGPASSQQQQQHKPGYHLHQRPEPEFYASLLQPGSPAAAATAAGDLQELAANPQPATRPASSIDTAAAAAAASNSWDPLGAVRGPPS